MLHRADGVVPIRHVVEIAQAVLYLASDDARNMSGTEIVLDGGATGAPYGAAVFTRG